MSTSVLIDDTIAAVTKKAFRIEGDRPVTVFANGLQSAETVAVQMLTKGETPDEADDTQWTAINDGGGALALTATRTRVVLTAPGDYRLVTGSSTAGAVRIGLMQ